VYAKDGVLTGEVLTGTWTGGVFDNGTYKKQLEGEEYEAYGDWYKESDGKWVNYETKDTWEGDLDDSGRPKR
jgi:hypothetical protein